MKRIVFYVVSCTSEENEKGIFHYSEPYKEVKNTRTYAEKVREALGNDGHVAIEKHHEVFDHIEWRIDHDNGGSVHIDYL